MKVEILKKSLKNGLSVVERIVGRNPSLPILDNVFVDTEGSFLKLTSTDLETAVRFWVLAKVVKKGRVVVPAKLFSDVVSFLPNDKVLLEEKKQNLVVDCKNFKNQIQGFNPEEFPLIPEFKNADFLEVDNKKIYEGLVPTVDIISPSQSRPEISGVYFSFTKNILKIVATDSFRLAEKTILLDAPIKKDTFFILPQKPAKEVVNVLTEKDGRAKIFFSPNQIMFEFFKEDFNQPQVQIFSRLIDGEYPNYEEIIPKKFKTSIIVKRDEFLNHIKTASLFSGKVNEIKIKIKTQAKEVEVFAQNPDVGESQSSISAKIEGEPMEISFNHKFLTDGLLNIKSSEVVFGLSREDGPCVLKPIGDTSYLYVVMPIKSS